MTVITGQCVWSIMIYIVENTIFKWIVQNSSKTKNYKIKNKQKRGKKDN